MAQSLEGTTYPDPRFYDCNKLALKLFYHAATIYWLRQGSRGPVPEPDGAFFFDAASVAVVARTALETYLAMFELFFEKTSDDEREFRHACWLLRGLVIREDVVPLTDELAEKIAQSSSEIESLRTRIKSTNAYASLSNKQKRQVISGAVPSPSLEARLRAAGFSPTTVRRMNRYLSSYVHSDGLSAIQLMGTESRAEQQEHIETMMSVVMMAMAKMILEYRNLFPVAARACAARPQSLETAEIWSGIASLMDQLHARLRDSGEAG